MEQIVTKIEELSGRRRLVYINGEQAFALYSTEVRRYGIAEGKVLASEDLEQLRTELLDKRAVKRAMYLLQAKDYTEKELTEKLQKDFYPQESVEGALAYVRHFGYLSDERFAQMYVQFKGQKKSRKQIELFLQKKGIRHFFGYQGTMIAHLVDSIERNPETENHSGYNEQGAAFAACGYAQAKEECACAYATSGPGAINLLSGVADAYYDSLPVIFLTGQLNTYEYSGIKGLRQQGFQETDIVAMAKPITKYAVQIRNPEDIVEELNKAYHIATTGRRGPVLIDLPMNIQRSEVENPVYDMTNIQMQLQHSRRQIRFWKHWNRQNVR